MILSHAILGAFEIDSWSEIGSVIGIATVLLGGLGSVVGWRRRRSFSGKQREILGHSAETGDILVMTYDGGPTWVRAGNVDLGKEQDRGNQALYVDELNDLVRRGFAEVRSKDYFRLTGSGFAVARRCANRCA